MTRETDWNDTSDPAVRQAEREEREDYEWGGCDTAEGLERDEDALLAEWEDDDRERELDDMAADA